MIKNIIIYFKNKKENELEKQKKLDYIQKRVMETGIEKYKNCTKENNTRSKQYFFDSKVYGEVLK